MEIESEPRPRPTAFPNSQVKVSLPIVWLRRTHDASSVTYLPLMHSFLFLRVRINMSLCIIQAGLVLFALMEVGSSTCSSLLVLDFYRIAFILLIIRWDLLEAITSTHFQIFEVHWNSIRDSTFPFIANLRNGDSFFCLRIYGSVGRGSGDRACDDVSDRTAKCSILSTTPVEIPGF